MTVQTLGESATKATQEGAGFLAQAARVLRAPGPAPREWVHTTRLLLAGVLAAAGVVALAGWLTRGDPGRYFGEQRPGTLLSAGLLAASAETCRRIHRLPAAAALFGRFWVVHAGLFAYLGLDELFRVHERLDRTIHKVLGLHHRHPVTDHLDDAILLGYAAFAAALWYRRRRALIRLPWTVLTMVAAFAAFAAMMAVDLTAEVKAVEDTIKLLAGALILSAFFAARREVGQLGSGGAEGSLGG